MNIPNWLKTVISFLLAILLVYLSIKNISADDWQSIQLAVGKTKWGWIFASLLLAVLSHLSRAFRWQQMLNTLGKKTQFLLVYAAQCFGYLVNLALPRAGEISRAGIVSRYEKISLDKVLGTIFNDRIIDVFFLFSITALSLLLEFEVIGTYTYSIFEAVQQKLVKLNYWLLLLIGVVGLIIFGILAKQFRKIWEKLVGIAKNFGQGISAVLRVKNKILFIFHSFFIWFMYFAMIYACMQATTFTAPLSASVALVLLAFGTWGFILTPGGIGAYPIVIASILALYGIDYNLGIAFGWIIWAAQTVLNLLLGVLSLVYLGVKKPQATA